MKILSIIMAVLGTLGSLVSFVVLFFMFIFMDSPKAPPPYFLMKMEISFYGAILALVLAVLTIVFSTYSKPVWSQWTGIASGLVAAGVLLLIFYGLFE